MLLESLSQPDRNTPFMHTAMIILVSTGKIHLCLQKHDRCRFGHRNYVFQIITSSYTYPSWASEYFQGIRVHTCCCAWKCNSKKKKSRISNIDQHNMSVHCDPSFWGGLLFYWQLKYFHLLSISTYSMVGFLQILKSGSIWKHKTFNYTYKIISTCRILARGIR